MRRENDYDVIIIGAGLLGCFAARALSSYKLKVLVLESREDVCCEVSKANTGIIYDSYNTSPGSLKTELTNKANENFPELCRELDVPYLKCGSVMIAMGPKGDSVIKKKYENGLKNGVKGLKILSGEEVNALEPNLSKNITSGLYSENTYSVNPWDLAVAAYENAKANGVTFLFKSKVTKITRNDGFKVVSDKNIYQTRAVINCAGLAAADVHNMCNPASVELKYDAADYYVLDTTSKGLVSRIILHEPEVKQKGINLVPTVDGNILVGPTRRGVESDFYDTENAGFEHLDSECDKVLDGLDKTEIIRNFGAVRPNPYYINSDEKINNFLILENDGFISLLGVKTPGLTCASELGKYVTGKITEYLENVEINQDFNPVREGIIKPSKMEPESRNKLVKEHPEYGRVICRCRQVTEGEVIEAVRRGATTVDGVKRRTGAGMGRCQGAYCMQRVMEIISEQTGCSISDVNKSCAGTDIVYEKL